MTLYGKRMTALFRVLKDRLGRQYGWKVFGARADGTFVGDYCGYRTVRPKGKWLKAQDFTPSRYESGGAMSINNYRPGWHVFRKRESAMGWGSLAITKKIVKVLVRKVREKGFVNVHGRADCFVADEIFIPK